MSERFRLETPKGEVSAAWHDGGKRASALVVAHGAGAGMDHPFMKGFCEELAAAGVSALRFNFPYLEAGRKSPGSPKDATAAVVAAVRAATIRMPAAGLVFLGYPLHAPGRSDQPRDGHLYGLKIPMLFLQGTKDPFADPDVLAGVLRKLGKRATYVPFEDAGHSFERSRKDKPRDNTAPLVPHVVEFVNANS
jgi:predicted alpha/beta-hydrolase family hydrolase